MARTTGERAGGGRRAATATTARRPAKKADGARPRRPASSSRRDEILATAADVFAEQGFVGATVRDVADAVGILSGSLYHHFDSKESMLDEILSGYFADRLDAYRAAIAEGGTPAETLAAMVHEVLRSTAEHHSIVLILHNDWPYLAQFDRFSYLSEASDEVEGLWVGVIRAGIEDGSFRADLDAPITFRTIMGATSWVARWYRPDGRESMRDIAEAQVDIFLHGLAAPRPPA